MTVYLEQIMDLLFIILQNENIPTDVKIVGISALGDICLITERAFHPYMQ
jgi:hypothetical protein